MDNTPPVNHQFDLARNQAKHDEFQKQALDDKAMAARINAGNEDEQTPRPINSALIEKDENGRPKNKNDRNKSAERLAFRAMLKQIDKQLTDIQQKLAQLHEKLQAKYGEDVIGGIAETHLSPDVLDKCETDEDKMKALAELMLNPDGSIKDKYKGLPEAQYVQMWREKEFLEFKLGVFEPILTPEEEERLNEILDNASISAANRVLAESINQHLNEKLAATNNEARAALGDVKIGSALVFGRS